MRKIKVTKTTPDSLRVRIIRFINIHGDGHITLRTIKWLQNTSFSSMNFENGDLIHICLDNANNICGIIAVSQYGLKHSIIVVHSKMRKKGIATNLIIGLNDYLDRLYFRVANDNIPSLKLCFSIGMRAFKLIKGPTGKPTLVLGYGNYISDEWDRYNSNN